MFHRVVRTVVFFISFLFSFCMIGNSHAEKVELEPLVVTATRVEAPLREVGSSHCYHRAGARKPPEDARAGGPTQPARRGRGAKWRLG